MTKGNQNPTHHSTIKNLQKSSGGLAHQTAIGDKQRPIEK